MTHRFEIKPFDSLTLHELYNIMHLRDVVFVVGQKITAVSEIDGEDPRCQHVLFYLDDRLIGTTRIFDDVDPMIVSRVAIHSDVQGEGYGRKMMEEINAWLGDRPAEMHAQAHLTSWYQSVGWEPFGDIFDEAEIPHQMMGRNLSL